MPLSDLSWIILSLTNILKERERFQPHIRCSYIFHYVSKFKIGIGPIKIGVLNSGLVMGHP